MILVESFYGNGEIWRLQEATFVVVQDRGDAEWKTIMTSCVPGMYQPNVPRSFALAT